MPDSSLVSYFYQASSFGGYHDPNVACIHDVEAPLEDGYARSLIGPNWFGGPASTSTHYLVGPDDICQGLSEGRIAWHCGNGNRGSIAIEQCGYARYNLAQWNSPKGLVQQDNVAKLLADINRRRPLIRLRTLSDAELRYALNNPGTPGGIVTHDQMRRAIGGTTHYDPYNAPNAGVAYPLDSVISRAVQYRNGQTPEEDDIVDQSQFNSLMDGYLSDPANVKKFQFGLPSANDVWQEKITSKVDGQQYRVWEYTATFDQRLEELQRRVRGYEADVDSFQSLAMGIQAIRDDIAAFGNTAPKDQDPS